MPSPSIITRAQWGARYPNGFGIRRIGKLDKILHHTVTRPTGNPYADIRAVERIGQQRFGRGISYTFLVHPDGTIFEGLGIDRIGAHTTDHNTTGAAICLIGNYENQEMTAAQRRSIIWLLREGVRRGWWRLPTITWGHRQVKASGTACPGTNAFHQIPSINREASSVDAPVVEPPKKKEEDDDMFVTKYGSSAWRLITGDRIVGISAPDALELINAGVKHGALSNDGVRALEAALKYEGPDDFVE